MGVIEKFTEESSTHVFIIKDEKKEEKRVELDATDIENIFKGYRPRNMSLGDFKEVSKIIKKEVKSYLNGTLIHLSKVSPELWKQYYQKGMINTHRQRGYTYIKKEHENTNSEDK